MATNGEPALVYEGVGCPAQQQQVIEVRLALGGPVFYVMRFQQASALAAWKYAMAVACVYVFPERMVRDTLLAADIERAAGCIMQHRRERPVTAESLDGR